ncbi:methyltransferase [Streptomyces sp. ISL-96]|uniref:methyltransferase n=1 Tax=Streptomyces sp. ISL-96 TaxID=2819191 RepID=UPI002034E568|nr:methyltransferase [Streptomyces sp. ISL-96]
MSDATQPTQATEIAAAVRQVLGDSLGYLYPAALRVALRTDIAGHLTDGPKTAAQLAELTGVHAPSLHRVLRFLATRGIFREDTDSAFHLTPAAHVLRTDVPYSVRSTALLLTDEMYWKSTGRLEDTVRDGSTAFNDIFGAPLFDYLDQNEESARTFHTGIADLSAIEQGGIAASYDFPATGKIIDVGGGPGGFLRTVLANNPGLHGVLYEQDAVLQQHQLDDEAIAGRWETAEGNFFDVAPTGGDIYVLKRVLHDWSDDDSLRILQAVRKAMSDQARLLVVDAVVPPGNDPHPAKLYDVAMMTIFDGKERTEPEFKELLAAAGLRLVRVIPTPGTVSILEAVTA